MSLTIMHYYDINKTLMSYIGIWPAQSKTVRILIPSVMMFTAISSLVAESLQIKFVLNTWCDIDKLFECSLTIIVVLICYTKLLNVSFKIKEIRNLFSLIEYHWSVFNNSMDVKILQDYAVFGRKMIMIYAIYFYVSGILYICLPMTPQFLDIVTPHNESRPRKFLFEIDYYGIDKDKYYYPIMAHYDITVMQIISIVVGVDTAYILYVQHGCGLFAAIGYRLERIASEGDVDNASYVTKDKEGIHSDANDEDMRLRERAIFRELITCLRKHQLAIKYVNALESSFTISTGAQLFFNMIMISIGAIQVLINLKNTDEFIRYIGLTISAFSHLFCMSLPGQRLIDHSIDVFDKACRSRWYTFSLRSKSLLRILLYRSFVPCTLTAGKIYVMSMNNFATIVQAAVSYFMTFSSMK